jgi:hypothetical protein
MEYEEIPPDRKCCLNCAAFEERTGFCRRHPPRPIPAQFMRNQQQQYYIPVFPKIALPHVDWCEDGIFNDD